jgi:hypothetical protein
VSLPKDRSNSSAQHRRLAITQHERGGLVEYSELVDASRPDALLASWTAHLDDLRQAAGGHDHGDLTSTRPETFKGHHIVDNTTYQITVDNRPFDAPVVVDNSGHVRNHGLPTREFVSTVDFGPRRRRPVQLRPAPLTAPPPSSTPDRLLASGTPHPTGCLTALPDFRSAVGDSFAFFEVRRWRVSFPGSERAPRDGGGIRV